MMIDSSIIKCSDDMNSKMVFTKILSVIQAHNNKVESIKISYALARHYFDKGIPDDEWFVSPGINGSSVQYMPHFNDEHYLIRYWYCFLWKTFTARYNLWETHYTFLLMSFTNLELKKVLVLSKSFK